MEIICGFSLVFSFLVLFASCVEKQVYVVYFGSHGANKTSHEIGEMHHSYLSMVIKNEEEARGALVYSYKHHINGFAALLTQSQASQLSELKDVVSIVESSPRQYSLQTTRSWEFLGLEGIHDETLTVRNWSQLSAGSDMLKKAKFGQNIIVGIIDSGIWPESTSFSDEGLSPPPERWDNNNCHSGFDFHISCCNRKIVGAKYYQKGFEQHYGPISHPNNYKSPRDLNGHGTHIASIVSGRIVKNVEGIAGLASGTISGGASMSHLAIYKVCWQTTDKQIDRRSDCLLADVIAGIDDAIRDGVDVMSISIGKSLEKANGIDMIGIAALHAIEKNIVVVGSAGDHGPELETVSNVAPWILTTASSSIDRKFTSTLTLENGKNLEAQAITPFELRGMHPLVMAAGVEVPTLDANLRGQCTHGSLSELAKQKIVLCHFKISNIMKINVEVARVGGIGIVGLLHTNEPYTDVQLPLSSHPIPQILVTTPAESNDLSHYISTTSANERMASIGSVQTMEGNQVRAPQISAFSGKGPSQVDRHILKPDLIAPGLNILATWKNQLIEDISITNHKIDSGSSIAAAHVAAVVVLLKSIHPTWSAAAIKSAIMTTAEISGNTKSTIRNYEGERVTPIDLGSGHLNPTKTVDPGLVYDVSYKNYLNYLCSIGQEDFVKSKESTFSCPEVGVPSYDLNYPSIAVSYKNEKVQIKRTITNVGDGYSKYVFRSLPPKGFLVKASPDTLDFDHIGQTKSFTIIVTRDTTISTKFTEYAIGYYGWKDGSRVVRSPIVLFLE